MSSEQRALIAQAWPDILQDIRDGERVDLTCNKYGIDRRMLWKHWSTDPVLRAAWYDALKDSADAYFTKAIQAADDADVNPKAARVRANIYQWAAEKRDPDRFGQRTRADINIKTVDLTSIIADANNRLAAARQNRIIDVTPSNTAPLDVHTQETAAITAAIAKAADLF